MLSKKLIIFAFLGSLFGVPLGQLGWELAQGGRVQFLDLWPAFKARRLAAFEDHLRQASFVRLHLVPHYQSTLSHYFGRGNERAIEARQGRLFYSDDLDLVSGPGFFDAGGAGQSALDAIADFRDQLRERDIALLVVPVPIKAMVDAQYIQIPSDAGVPLNSDHARFFRELDALEIEVVDLLPEYARWEKEDASQGLYLARDTHWTPAVMDRVAEILAREVLARETEQQIGLLESPPLELVPKPVTVRGQGDLVRMLRLPAGQTTYEPMELQLEEVHRSDSGEPLEFDRDAEVLLLGDSFSLVFSDPALDMGQHAGLGEHLALHLRRPVDAISLLGGSATAVRETLARRAEGLRHKKIVIWEFGMRLLCKSPDDWRKVPMPAATETSDASSAVEASDPLVVIAEVVETTRVSEDFDYEFCLSVYEYRVVEVLSGSTDETTLWVAYAAMVDFEMTAANAFEVGERHRLVLDDLSLHYSLEKTSWIDDTDAGEVIHWATEWKAAK